MLIIIKDIINEPESIIIKVLIKELRYSFWKRKILIDEEEVYRSKIIKAMIVITDLLDKDDIEFTLVIA
jgi:hypothetical protein